MIPAIEYSFTVRRDEIDETKTAAKACLHQMVGLDGFLVGIVDYDPTADGGAKVTAFFSNRLASRNQAGEVVNASDRAASEFASAMKGHLPTEWRFVLLPDVLLRHAEILGYTVKPTEEPGGDGKAEVGAPTEADTV